MTCKMVELTHATLKTELGGPFKLTVILGPGVPMFQSAIRPVTIIQTIKEPIEVLETVAEIKKLYEGDTNHGT